MKYPAATLYMTLGLSGSGKTHWSQAEIMRHPAGAIVRVNKDSLRAMAHQGRFAGKQTEAQIVAMRDALVRSMLLRQVDVIVDDTNLAIVHENTLREIAAECNANFKLVDFTTVPVATCIKRDAARPENERVGSEVIKKQAETMLRRSTPKYPMAPDEYVPKADLPACVLVDLDGTLALNVGRSPYEWNRVGEDAPNPDVVDLVKVLRAGGEQIIVLSGRDGSCRQESQAWLDEYVGAGLPLLMRQAGDQRRDDIVKKELFDTHIRDQYRVKLVLDDRQRVVDMWRRVLGLTVLQVAPGDFDARSLRVPDRKQVQMPDRQSLSAGIA